MRHTDMPAHDIKQKIHALLQQQRLDEARPLLEQVCQNDQGDAEAWLALATVHLASGALESAERCCRRAIAIRPDDAEAHYCLGLTLAARREPAQAAESHRRALALAPNVAIIWTNLGNALVMQEQMREAAPCFRRALELQPDLAPAWNNLANAELYLGRAEEAIACYQRAIQMDSRNPDPYFGIAVALAGTGRLDQATTYLRQSLQLKPGDDDAHVTLAAIDLAQACRDNRSADHAPPVETTRTMLGQSSTTDSCHVVFFHIDPPASREPARDSAVARYREMAEMMLVTAKKCMPNCTTAMLTDRDTPAPAGVDAVVRAVRGTHEELMLVNVALQRAYLETVPEQTRVAFVDTDLILRRDLAPVFSELAERGAEIGLTWRHNFVMPYNYGVIFVRNGARARSFFAELERRTGLLAPALKRWYGNQIALATMVGRGFHIPTEPHSVVTCPVDGLRLLLLPCDRYNFSPDRIEHVTDDKYVLHFKGNRKQLMEEVYRRMCNRTAGAAGGS